MSRSNTTDHSIQKFFEAIKARDMAAVQKLLNLHTDCDLRDSDGLTPLHYASYMGCRDICELLIRRGARINTKANEGQTPLFFAVSEGYTAVAKALIDSGADTNILVYDVSLLFPAVSTGKVNLVKLLIDAGLDVNDRAPNGGTPLYVASGFECLEIVKLLIDEGADVNAATNEGSTPLMQATFIGNTSIIDVLIKNKALINTGDNRGRTPLFIAFAMGHKEVISLLSKFIDKKTVLNYDVLAELAVKGCLRFRRCANLLDIMIIGIVGVVFIGLSVLFSPKALFSTGSQSVSVAWPYDAPAEILIEKNVNDGIRIGFKKDRAFFNKQSRNIEFQAKILTGMDGGFDLLKRFGIGLGTTTKLVHVRIEGLYSTEVKKGYVPSPELLALATIRSDAEQDDKSIQKGQAARKLVRLLELVQDNDGFIQRERFPDKDTFYALVSKGLLVEDQIMVDPKHFRLKVPVSIHNTTPLVFSGFIFFVVFLVAILTYYIFSELAKYLPGNEIVLTTQGLRDNRRGVFKKTSPIFIPWNDIEVGEHSRLDLSSGGEKESPKIIVNDRRTKISKTYSRSTVRQYFRLRAALIALVGIMVTTEYEPPDFPDIPDFP